MAMNYQSAVRSTGKVNWFSDDEGFGFITPDDGGEKLFVQQSSIVSFGVTSLTVGESVGYVIRRGKGGIDEAAKVTALGFGVECFICGNLGHIARNCTQSVKCFGCGNLGHIAKDCTQSEVQCYSCQKFGHKARNCPQGGGGSGGGGGGGSGGGVR